MQASCCGASSSFPTDPTRPRDAPRPSSCVDDLDELLAATGGQPNRAAQDESQVLLHPEYYAEIQRGSPHGLAYARRRMPLLIDLALGRLDIVEHHRHALWRLHGSTQCSLLPEQGRGVMGDETASRLAGPSASLSTDPEPRTSPCAPSGHQQRTPSATFSSPSAPHPASAAQRPACPPRLSVSETNALATVAVKLLCGKTASGREGAADAQTSTMGPVWDAHTTRRFFAHHRDEVTRICAALSDACERLERVVPTARSTLFGSGKQTRHNAREDADTAAAVAASVGTDGQHSHSAGQCCGIGMGDGDDGNEDDEEDEADWLLLPASGIEPRCCPWEALAGHRNPAGAASAETRETAERTNRQSPPAVPLAPPAPGLLQRNDEPCVPSLTSQMRREGVSTLGSQEDGGEEVAPAQRGTSAVRRVKLSALPQYLSEQCGIVQNSLLLLESLLVAMVMENALLSLLVRETTGILEAAAHGMSAAATSAEGVVPSPPMTDPFSIDVLTSPWRHRTAAGAPGTTCSDATRMEEEEPFMRRAAHSNGPPSPHHRQRPQLTEQRRLPDGAMSLAEREKEPARAVEDSPAMTEEPVKFVVERATQAFLKAFLSITTIQNQLSKYSYRHGHHHGLCVAAAKKAAANKEGSHADAKKTAAVSANGLSDVPLTLTTASMPRPAPLAVRPSSPVLGSAATHDPSADCEVCQRFDKVVELMTQHVEANMSILKLVTIALVAHDTDISEAAIKFIDAEDAVFTAQATMLFAHVLTPELLAAHPTASRGGKALRWMMSFVFGGCDSDDVARTQRNRRVLRADSNPFSIAGSNGSEKGHREVSVSRRGASSDNVEVRAEDESDFSFASGSSSSSSSRSSFTGPGNEGPDTGNENALADSYNSIDLRVEYILGACFTRCHPLMTVVGMIAESDAYECGTVVAKAVLQYAVTLSHTSARLLRTPLLTTRWSTPFTEAMMRGLNELAKLTHSEAVLLGSPASSYSSGWVSTEPTTDSEGEARNEELGGTVKESEEAPAAGQLSPSSTALDCGADDGGGGGRTRAAAVVPSASSDTLAESATGTASGEGSLKPRLPASRKSRKLSHKASEEDLALHRAVKTLSAYLQHRPEPTSSEAARAGSASALALPPVIRLPPLTRVYMERRRHRFRPRPRGDVTGTTAADRAESARSRTHRRAVALQWAKCVILSARTLIKCGITKVPVPREHYDTLSHQSKRLQGMLDDWFARERAMRGGDGPPPDSVPRPLESASPFSVLESKISATAPQLSAAAEEEEAKESGAGDGVAKPSAAHERPPGFPSAKRSGTHHPTEPTAGANNDGDNDNDAPVQTAPPPRMDTKPPRTIVSAKYQQAFADSFCFGKDTINLFTEPPYVSVPVHEVLFASFFTILDAVSDVVLCEEPRLNTIFINELMTLLYELRLSMLEARTNVELITPQTTRFRSLSERDAAMNDDALSAFELLYPAEYGVLMKEAFRCEEVIDRWRSQLERNPNHPAAGFASLLHHLHRKLERYEHPTKEELLISRATLRLLLGVTARDEAGDIHGGILHVDDLDVAGTKKEEIAPRLGVTASMDAMRGSRDDLQQLIRRQNIDVGLYRTPSHSHHSSARATPVASDNDDEGIAEKLNRHPNGSDSSGSSSRDSDGDSSDGNEVEDDGSVNEALADDATPPTMPASSTSPSSLACDSCGVKRTNRPEGDAGGTSHEPYRGQAGGRHRRHRQRMPAASDGRPSSPPLARAEEPPARAPVWLSRINEGQSSFYSDSLAASPLHGPSGSDTHCFEVAAQPSLQGSAAAPNEPLPCSQEETNGVNAEARCGAAANWQHPRSRRGRDETRGGSSPQPLSAAHICSPNDASATPHARTRVSHRHAHHGDEDGDSRQHRHPHREFAANHMARSGAPAATDRRLHSIKAIGSAADMVIIAQRAPATWGIPTASEILRLADRQELAKEPALAHAIEQLHTQGEQTSSGMSLPTATPHGPPSPSSPPRPPVPVLNNTEIEQRRQICCGGRGDRPVGVAVAERTPSSAVPHDETLYILQVLLPAAPGSAPPEAASAGETPETHEAQVSPHRVGPTAAEKAAEAAPEAEDGAAAAAARLSRQSRAACDTVSPPFSAPPSSTGRGDEGPSTGRAEAVEAVATRKTDEGAGGEEEATEWNLRRFDPDRPPHWAPPPGTLPAVKRSRHGLSPSVLSLEPHGGGHSAIPTPTTTMTTTSSSNPASVSNAAASTRMSPSTTAPGSSRVSLLHTHHAARDGRAVSDKGNQDGNEGDERVTASHARPLTGSGTSAPAAAAAPTAAGTHKRGKRRKPLSNASFDLSRMPNARRLLETMDSSNTTATTTTLDNKSFSFFATPKMLFVSSDEDDWSEDAGREGEDGTGGSSEEVERDGAPRGEDNDEAPLPRGARSSLSHRRGQHPSSPEGRAASPSALLDDSGETVPVSLRTASAAASIVRDCERQRRTAKDRENFFPFPHKSLQGSRDVHRADRDAARTNDVRGDGGGRQLAGNAADGTDPSAVTPAAPPTADADLSMGSVYSPAIPRKDRGETFAFPPRSMTDSSDDVAALPHRRPNAAAAEPRPASEGGSHDVSPVTTQPRSRAASSANAWPALPRRPLMGSPGPLSCQSNGSTPPTAAGGSSMLRSCFSSGRTFGSFNSSSLAAALLAPFGHRPPSPSSRASPTVSFDSAGSPWTPGSPAPYPHPPPSENGSSTFPSVSIPLPPSQPAEQRMPLPLPAHPPDPPPQPDTVVCVAAAAPPPEHAQVLPLTSESLSAQQQQQSMEPPQPPQPPEVLSALHDDKAAAHPPKRVQFANLPPPAPPFLHAGSTRSAGGSYSAHRPLLHTSDGSGRAPERTTSHASSENLSDLST